METKEVSAQHSGGYDEDRGVIFAVYLKYHRTVCEHPELAGRSHHTLDIFRKEAP